MENENNYFTELEKVTTTGKVETKNGLKYLSWAYAWQMLKERHPDANYIIYENKDEWNYFTDGKTAWVKVGVIVNGIEHKEMLPVMDNRNKSIPLEQIDSFAVNKAIQRCLTKAIARHGIGLSLYTGEDLPEEQNSENNQRQQNESLNQQTTIYNGVQYNLRFSKKNNDYFWLIADERNITENTPKFLRYSA